MVHGRDCVQTYGTVFFNGVEDGADGAEKHLIHLTQVDDCRLVEISKQKEHLVSDEDNDAHDGNVDGEDDSVGNGDDNGADDGAEKNFVHLTQVADCRLAEISKLNEHLLLEQDNDVHDDTDDGEDDSVGNGDYGGADDSADGAEKHLIHLAQVVDCHQVEISKQNKHLLLEQDNDGHDGNVGGEDDSVGNGDYGSADDGADGAEKHLIHLAQVALLFPLAP
eukprot:2897261-Ditylum_brightwellii.AAC.1